MKRTILAAVVAVAALAPNAQAQSLNPIKFGISGGVSVPASDPISNEDGSATSKPGYNIGGHLGVHLPLFPIGLRADIGFNSFAGKETSESNAFGSARGKADVTVFAGTLNAVIQPTGMLLAKPYIIGGVGAYRVKTQVEGSVDLGSGAFPFSDSETTTDVGLNGGLGVRFGLAGFSTFAEARYHYVFNEESCGNSVQEFCIGRKATTFVPVSFGIMF